VQNLRALAALGVVLFHTRLWQQHNFAGQTVIGEWSAMGQAGADLFFVISGFIMMHSTWRPFRGWRDQRNFLARRFLRIYPAYWAIGLPVLLISCWNPNFLGDIHGNRVKIINSIFALPGRDAPALVVAWTIVYEIYFYLVASFLFYLDRRGRLIAGGLWFLALVLVNTFHPHNHNPYGHVITSPLSMEFITGMFLAVAFRSELPTLRPVYAASACALAGLAIYLIAMSHPSISFFYDHQRWRVLCYGPPVTVILAMALWMQKQGHWQRFGKLAFLGDRSYSLYLLHIVVLELVYKYTFALMPHAGLLVVALSCLLAYAIVVPATEFLYRTVERPFQQLGHLARRESSLKSDPPGLALRENGGGGS